MKKEKTIVSYPGILASDLKHIIFPGKKLLITAILWIAFFLASAVLFVLWTLFIQQQAHSLQYTDYATIFSTFEKESIHATLQILILFLISVIGSATLSIVLGSIIYSWIVQKSVEIAQKKNKLTKQQFFKAAGVHVSLILLWVMIYVLTIWKLGTVTGKWILLAIPLVFHCSWTFASIYNGAVWNSFGQVVVITHKRIVRFLTAYIILGFFFALLRLILGTIPYPKLGAWLWLVAFGLFCALAIRYVASVCEDYNG